MTLNETFQEIQGITLKLIECGFSVHQNFPFRREGLISCKEGVDLNSVLKNVSYDDKYFELDRSQSYNFKLTDGALVQLMYTFNPPGRIILSHRLAYFPAPNLINYEDDPLAHEEFYFGNSEFHDLIDLNVVKTPFRFDFNSREDIFEDIQHPYCHLHLGEYETCRIPVCGPITPAMFMNFILRNFYNTALREICGNYSFNTANRFTVTITKNESKLLHLGFK